jgi:ADP-ribosylglycohydrolase
VRLAISLGGDADTLACITGGIAEAFYFTEVFLRLLLTWLWPFLMIDFAKP